MTFEKQYLYSDERLLGDGFNPREIEFFELTENQKFNDGWVLDSFGGIGFQMSLNT